MPSTSQIWCDAGIRALIDQKSLSVRHCSLATLRTARSLDFLVRSA
jgi:hypothetical protein